MTHLSWASHIDNAKMTYCLRNRHTLEEKLGTPVLAKLFELIRKGSIEKSHMKSLSYDYNMNLYTTFTRGEDRGDVLETIFQDMLDRWCDQTLGSLPPEEAFQLLIRHLEETCSDFVVHSIREIRQEVTGNPRASLSSPLPSQSHLPNRRQNPTLKRPETETVTYHFHGPINSLGSVGGDRNCSRIGNC